MQLVKETFTLPDSYSITGEQEEIRNAIALRARKVSIITTTAENALAGVSAKEIRRHLKEVEDYRVSYTAPLLAGQRLLKSLADEYCAPLKAELARLERMGTDFLLAEERRVAEAERQRQREIQRLDQERIAAEEAAAKAARKINTDNQLANAVQKEQVAFAAAEKVQAAIVAPLPEVVKAKGQSLQRDLKYEVLDIAAVYRARPELCKLEIKPSAVQATCVPEVPVPGLRLWWQPRGTFSSR